MHRRFLPQTTWSIRITIMIFIVFFISFFSIFKINALTGQIEIPTASDWTRRGVALQKSGSGHWDQFLSPVQDDGMLSASSIVKLNGTYYLYYIGAKGTYTTGSRTGPGNRALGVATSSDGINFTKYAGNPIITYQPRSDPEEGVFVGIGSAKGSRVYMYYGAIKRRTPTEVDVSVRLRESTNGINFTNDRLVYEVANQEVWPYTAIFTNNQWMVWAGKFAPVDLLRGSASDKLSPTSSQLNSGSVYGYGVVDIGNGKIAMLYDKPMRVAVADATNPTSWQNVTSYPNINEGDAGKTWFLDTEQMLWFMYIMNPNGDTIDVYTAPAHYGTTTPPPPVNSGCFGNSTNPPPPINANLSNVNFIDQDVSGWRQTAHLSPITYTNINDFNNAKVCLDFDKTDVWPTIDGDGDKGVNANAWVCAYRGSKWECGTFEWIRPGAVCKDPPQGAGVFSENGQLKTGSLRTFWPQVGETYGFMISGTARTGAANNVQERSNIVMSQWPIKMSPSCPTSSIPPSIPPSLEPIPFGGITALSGKNPSLAFNPISSFWLVVAENGGKIQGQFMTNGNKLSGSLLNIGGSDAHTPKIAYGPSINKYLVVWTSGKDPNSVLWGQLLSDSGSVSGPAIKIATGGAHLYSAGNIQYDSSKQGFVFAYEKAGNKPTVMLVGISGSGAITGPAKIADVSLISSAPSIAINTVANEYCATYMDGNKIKIQPILNSGPGTATDLSQGNGNAGITYNSTNNNYTVAWLSKDGDIVSKIISTCADDPEQDLILLSNNTKTGILVQNLNGFGLFAINSTNANDHFSWFDSSSNQTGDQIVFDGTWNPDGSWLSAGTNTLTSLYALTASPDAKTVKFVSGIGTPPTAPPNNGPFPPQTVLPVPDKGLPTDLGQLISTIFVWSLGIIGLVIFVRFFYAGFLWFTAAGNSSNVTKAQGIMKNAVYGALVLFSAWLILNTINPDLVGGTFNLPGLPAGQPPETGGTSCTNTASLAQQYKEPATIQNDPKLTALISCIKSKLPAGTALGEESTFDKSHPLCNYTRGNPVCETCSHTVNSCHYGGKAGTQGALAVDFGEEKSGDKIIQAAIACGVPSAKARCESGSGARVSCSDASATHVHISETSCDSN